MSISRWTITAAVLAASSMALAGCVAHGSAPPRLTEQQRTVIRAEIVDPYWAVVSRQYPGVVRPVVSVTRTIDDRDWSATMVSCLREAASGDHSTGASLRFQDANGSAAAALAISSYACVARYPTAGDVVQKLGRSQLGILYHYFVGVVRPCLLTAGAPSSPPPSLATFVFDSTHDQAWNPYQSVWTSGIQNARLRYLEERCPPIPAWLDLAK